MGNRHSTFLGPPNKKMRTKKGTFLVIRHEIWNSCAALSKMKKKIVERLQSPCQHSYVYGTQYDFFSPLLGLFLEFSFISYSFW